MTPIEYAVITTCILAVFYYAGVYVGKQKAIADVVENTLNILEKGNYIKVVYNEELKEKELISLDKIS
jgi:hypothetical protein|tara:strand:+ start:1157 stop:1360 length:204 start_codon:yes stop_codon:yes gene_type:complete